MTRGKAFLIGLMTIALVGLSPLSASAKVTPSKGECTIVMDKFRRDNWVKAEALWDVNKRANPVTIKPIDLVINAKKSGGVGIEMTRYEIRLYSKGSKLNRLIASNSDGYSYGWRAGLSTPTFKALDYPYWWVRVWVKKGKSAKFCTLTTRHVSW